MHFEFSKNPEGDVLDSFQVAKVNPEKPDHLIRYCADHGPEHDESFLPGRDFNLSPDYPAYLMYDGATPVGAVILMRTPHYRDAGRGRFSILHSVLKTRQAYFTLLEAVRPHFHDLDGVFLFLPEAKREVRSILEELGFAIERFSYVLENNETMAPEVRFPDGFTVHSLAPTDRTGIREFTVCVNECLGELAGHIASSPGSIRAWFDEEWYLEGGICLLRKDGIPAGTVCVMRGHENRESAEIGGLGILPPYRGRGLARMLLRHARSLAAGKGLHPATLCVNAENEKAITLYESEGFIPTETMVCYELHGIGNPGQPGLEDS
jgi:mycothiol synthase